jgi:hypothetical protein
MSVSELASAISGSTTNTFVLLAGECAYVTSPSGATPADSAATSFGSPLVAALSSYCGKSNPVYSGFRSISPAASASLPTARSAMSSSRVTV